MDTATEHKNNSLARMPTEKETKREKFLRLANKRLDSALDNIRLVENLLQNPYAYNYSHQDVEVIVQKLAGATARLKQYWRVRH